MEKLNRLFRFICLLVAPVSAVAQTTATNAASISSLDEAVTGVTRRLDDIEARIALTAPHCLTRGSTDPVCQTAREHSFNELKSIKAICCGGDSKTKEILERITGLAIAVGNLGQVMLASSRQALTEFEGKWGPTWEKAARSGGNGCGRFTQQLVDAASSDQIINSALIAAVTKCLDNGKQLLTAETIEIVARNGGGVLTSDSGVAVINGIVDDSDSGLWRIGTWGGVPLAGFVLGIGLTPEKKIYEEVSSGSMRTRYEFDTESALTNGAIGLAGGVALAGIIELIVWAAD